MLIPTIEPDYVAIRRKAHETMLCNHAQAPLRRKVATNGVATAWHQCANCGVKVGKAVPKKELGDRFAALPPWDDGLEMAFYKRRDQLQQKMVEAEKLRTDQERKRRYEEYLTTPEWMNRKHLVMERASGLCEGCRSHPATEVHHLTYEHAGDEFLFELVAICRKCHDRLHDRK